MNSLIIVESPTKVKTIGKYLGKDYEIRASVGHVKDLPKSSLGIDPERGFEPTYVVMDSKKKVIAELKKAASRADQILLAPDPDRESGPPAASGADIANLGDTEKRLLSLIPSRPVDIDLLITSSGLTAQEVLNALLILELRGYIRQMPGKQFLRKESSN